MKTKNKKIIDWILNDPIPEEKEEKLKIENFYWDELRFINLEQLEHLNYIYP